MWVLTLAKKLMKLLGLDIVLQRVSLYLLTMARQNPIDIVELWQREATQETLTFVKKNMPTAPSFEDRLELLEYALSRADVPGGLNLEFGVFKARSLNFIASKTKGNVYGFDSFEGLPEGWIPQFRKGAFKVARLPKVRGNVELVVGWFDRTLPPFLHSRAEKCAFVHVDCDLYSSTKAIFASLGPRIAKGTVIVFDEFFNYPNWQEGEYKAFMEFVRERKVQFEYLAFNRRGEQVAMKITKIG